MSRGWDDFGPVCPACGRYDWPKRRVHPSRCPDGEHRRKTCGCGHCEVRLDCGGRCGAGQGQRAAGGPQRRSQGWWRARAPERDLDPHAVTLRAGPIHRRDVERYKADPGSRATGGDPVCVVRRRDGSLFAREGAHRITAAREAGRRIRARLIGERTEQGR